ncbi:MAG: choice-of-anchor D domain-containing protein [Terracidiphilus sp.]
MAACVGGTQLKTDYASPSTLVMPTVTVTPSPANISTGQSLSVTVTVNGGSGNSTLAGSVMLTSGSYVSPSATLSSGSATITIPAGSLAAGTDTLAATYTPNSASSATYNSSMGAGAVTVSSTSTDPVADTSAQIFFSPFKDVTNTANWNTGEQQSAVTGTTMAVTGAMPTDNSTLTWAFATGICGSENWGGITPAMEATNAQDFVNAGKYYIVSTGGQNGTFDCPSDSGMQTFIQTYNSANMLGVDFDIELGQSQAIIDDLINAAIAGERAYPNMRFSFTIQTLGAASVPDLNANGTLVVNEINRLGLGGNYYVDLMAFDYGSVSSGNCVVSGSVCDMAQSAIAAAESLHSNFGIPYSHIELCLMIGQADAGASETLSLADVDTVVAWAKSVDLAGLHYWSFDRDQPSASSSSTGDGTSNSPLAYNREFTSDLGSCTGPGGSCGSSSSSPSFSLSDSPSSLSIAQGGSGTSTITVASSDGFDSAVSLSVSGLPSGVTASFSPSSVTPSANGSATSTITLTASSSATAGSATLTITGTSGSLTTTTTVALTVGSSSGSGCASAWSSTQVYTAGMTASENGIDYIADYWTEGQNPATNNGPASSGEPWISQGSCGTQKPSFTLSDSPGSLSIAQGASGTSTITVNPANGFSGSVTLSASGLPSGVTASFGTNPATGSSVLTLVASSAAATGSATVTITGISGSLSASTTIALTVTSNGSQSFSLSDSPSSLSIAQNASGASTITITSINNFDSAVTLSVSGLPSGVTASFSPSSVTPSADGSTTSTLTLTASSSATAGTTTVTITGTNGSLSATTAIALTVTAASGSGSVTLSPSSYNFGSTVPHTGTAWVTFMLSNNGSSAVSIGSASVSGPFVVYSNCGSSVAANSSCPIYVYFYPTEAGSFTGTLTVDDGASNSPQTASLSGTGS